MADERPSVNRGNFAEDREKASRAGQVGGKNSSGNFARDRERAAEAGRKGGRISHRGVGSDPSDGLKHAAGPEIDHDLIDDDDRDYDDRDAYIRPPLWSFLPLVDLRGWYS